MVDDMVDMINKYRQLLDQLDIEFPEDFVLQDVLDAKEKTAPTPPEPPAASGEVTGPSAETDRGKKSPAPEEQSEPPAAQP